MAQVPHTAAWVGGWVPSNHSSIALPEQQHKANMGLPKKLRGGQGATARSQPVLCRCAQAFFLIFASLLAGRVFTPLLPYSRIWPTNMAFSARPVHMSVGRGKPSNGGHMRSAGDLGGLESPSQAVQYQSHHPTCLQRNLNTKRRAPRFKLRSKRLDNSTHQSTNITDSLRM